MAFRRQHTLPMFLLAGFAASRERFTWLFRKDRDPVETNMINVAVGRDFYGRVQDTGVETHLNRRETEHAAFIRNVVHLGGVPPEAGSTAADFVTSIMVRSSHLRAAFSDTHNSLVTLLESDEFAERFLRFLAQIAPGEARRLLGLRRSAPIPGDIGKVFEKLSSADIKPYLGIFLEGFKSVPREEIVLSSQVRAILRDPGPRVRLYAGLRWRLYQATGPAFLLGDVGPIASYDGAQTFVLPIRENTTPDVICIPVSRAHLLLGERANAEVEVLPDAINRSIAELSATFFVASRNTNTERSYQVHIGKRFRFLELAEMSEIVDQALRELAEGGS